MKKLLTILLAFVFILSSFTMAFADNSYTYLDPSSNFKLDEDSNNPNANLRIIVELEDKPVINYATDNGVKVDELEKSTLRSLTSNLDTKQDSLKAVLSSKNIKFKIHNTFKNIFNGFSCTTTAKEAKEIAQLPGVKNVYVTREYPRPEPVMHEAVDTVNARIEWAEVGYTGEGQVVAIVDSGIDPSHHDMVLTNPENKKLCQDFIDNTTLAGKFYSDKVPYGYNYADENDVILDLGPTASRHGMHVAGIVGANGDEETGIKGIAPECQLLAMKVFGNGPSGTTTSDIYIKAIDDAILLGADVINMSLGSQSGFVSPNEPEQIAIKRATENGIVVAISAGNTHKLGNRYCDPFAETPDYGVVGTPSITHESVSVASCDNAYKLYENKIQINGMDNLVLGYGLDNWEKKLPEGELVAIGGDKLGEPSCYEDIDVTGKIVLVSRGAHTFADKTTWAYQQGAAGIVVYDHGLSTFHKDQGGWEVPFVLISKEDGLALEELLTSNDSLDLNVESVFGTLSPTAGLISDFSSWGCTPSLTFKPEITAPGGCIVSTDQDNKYQTMSGTSMSAPCISGGCAILLQYVEERFPTFTGSEKAQMAKNILMSTANPIKDQLTNTMTEYTSPRGQGAGLMDLLKATTTQSIVVDKTTGESKVALKEVGDKIKFTVSIKNYSSLPAFYKINGTVTSDYVYEDTTLNKYLVSGLSEPLVDENGKQPISFKYKYNFLDMIGRLRDLNKIDKEKFNLKSFLKQRTKSIFGNKNKSSKLSFDLSKLKNIVMVLPKSSTDVTVSIDLEDVKGKLSEKTLAESFENGTFIDGFVLFSKLFEDDEVPTLSIPYFGFYGEWDKQPVHDKTVYEDGSFYKSAGLLSLDTIGSGDLYYLGQDIEGGIDINNIAFSPNNDGVCDYLAPVLSFLRNAKTMDVDLVDGNGNKVADIIDENDIPKNYGIYSKQSFYYLFEEWIWNGVGNNGQIVPDGQYYYNVTNVIDYPNATPSVQTFPVYIDTVAPVVENVNYDEATKTITTTATDTGSQIKGYLLLVDFAVADKNITGTFDLSNLEGSHTVHVLAVDYAHNQGLSTGLNIEFN